MTIPIGVPWKPCGENWRGSGKADSEISEYKALACLEKGIVVSVRHELLRGAFHLKERVPDKRGRPEQETEDMSQF